MQNVPLFSHPPGDGLGFAELRAAGLSFSVDRGGELHAGPGDV